jgi:hypothetical protein
MTILAPDHQRRLWLEQTPVVPDLGQWGDIITPP